MVNAFLGQFEHDECIITIGQLTPPVLHGTPEERLKQLSSLPYIQMKSVAKLGLTRERLEEFANVLQETMRNFDQAKGGKR